jgi:nitrate reductase gamma subunit
MLPEMIFIKALWEHNRKLWYRSFPFHFGLYLMCGFAGLLVLGALLEIAGVSLGEGAGNVGVWLSGVTAVFGICGLVLGIAGGIGLIHMRSTDSDLRPYTNFSHFFNLGFITVALILLLAVWVGDRDFSALRGYVGSLFVLNLGYSAESSLVSLTVLVTSILIAYIPLTHMSHFFVKWFTWHKIRWDDEPNVKGGRFEVMIEEALRRPVTWAAEHVKADGRKSWADIATEEIEK